MYRLTIQNGIHKGQRLPLEPGTFTLGSDDSDDFRIEDPEVQPAHVELELREDGEIWLKRGASAPQVLVNGNRTGHARIRHGDEFQLGQVRLKLIDASFRDTTRSRRVGKMQRLTLFAVSLVLVLETGFILMFSLMRKGRDDLEDLRLQELAAARSQPTRSQEEKQEKGEKVLGPAARLGQITHSFHRDDQGLYAMALIEVDVLLRAGLSPGERNRLSLELEMEEQPVGGEWTNPEPLRPARQLALTAHPRRRDILRAAAVILRAIPDEEEGRVPEGGNLIRGRLKLFDGEEMLGQETHGFTLPAEMSAGAKPVSEAEVTVDESASDPET